MLFSGGLRSPAGNQTLARVSSGDCVVHQSVVWCSTGAIVGYRFLCVSLLPWMGHALRLLSTSLADQRDAVIQRNQTDGLLTSSFDMMLRGQRFMTSLPGR